MTNVEYIWIFEPCNGEFAGKRLVMIRRGNPPKTEVHGVFMKSGPHAEDAAKRHIFEYMNTAKHFLPDLRVINAVPGPAADGR